MILYVRDAETGTFVPVPAIVGERGATFTPSVDADGNLSWSNDGGLKNPATVNIRGVKGDPGANGKDADQFAPADIGAVAANQGAENAGKLLSVGLDGMVALAEGAGLNVSDFTVTFKTDGWHENDYGYQYQYIRSDTYGTGYKLVFADVVLSGGTNPEGDADIIAGFSNFADVFLGKIENYIEAHCFAAPTVDVPVRVVGIK